MNDLQPESQAAKASKPASRWACMSLFHRTQYGSMTCSRRSRMSLCSSLRPGANQTGSPTLAMMWSTLAKRCKQCSSRSDMGNLRLRSILLARFEGFFRGINIILSIVGCRFMSLTDSRSPPSPAAWWADGGIQASSRIPNRSLRCQRRWQPPPRSLF
jgi:hypothetical protein